MKKYFLIFLFLGFSSAEAQDWAKQYDYVDDCICGLAKVSKANKYGYVDQKGNLIVPLIYDEALTFNEGKAAVKKENRWGYLDNTGKVVVEPYYEDAGSFHDSLAYVKKTGKEDLLIMSMQL